MLNQPQNLQQLQNISAGSPHMGLPGTPNMQGQGQTQVRPPGAPSAGTPGNFSLPNNVPANLHIPASKQRNLSTAANAGSPMRPPMQLPPGAGMGAQQQGQIQRMIQAGIPVQPGVRPPMGGAVAPGGFPIKAQDITPQMLMSQLDPSSNARGPAERFRRMSDQPIPPGAMDRSASLLQRTTWQPSAESDSALLEKLNDFNTSIRPHGRATLAQGLGVSRVLGDVVLERMPDGLKAVADEAENDVDSEQKEEGGTGLPGQKKRKVQELAESIDRALVIDKEVETVSQSERERDSQEWSRPRSCQMCRQRTVKPC
jgi:hypothetical protein